MSDEFDDYEPEEQEQLPVLKFFTPGEYVDGSTDQADRFRGKILRVGTVFANAAQPNQTGDPGHSYCIDFEAEYVRQTPIKRQGSQKAYDPPREGEDVVLFVKVGSGLDKGLRKAAKNVGRNGVEVDGVVSIQFTKESKSKFAQPFKHIDVVKYVAPEVAEDDEFDQEEAPF